MRLVLPNFFKNTPAALAFAADSNIRTINELELGTGRNANLGPETSVFE
jgi:hypothetical protein